MWEVWLAKLAKYWNYWDESAKLDDLLANFLHFWGLFDHVLSTLNLWCVTSPISDLSSRPVSCPCLVTFRWVAALRFLSSAQWPAHAWRSCHRSTGSTGCAARWTWHRRCSAPGRCSESWWCWRWGPIQCCTSIGDGNVGACWTFRMLDFWWWWPFLGAYNINKKIYYIYNI